MKDFLKSLQFLFKPNYWLMNHSYSKEWDAELNYLLDNHKFTKADRYTAFLGEKKIWIANHPYASMTEWDLIPMDDKIRPSRLTIQRAMKQLKLNKVK